MSLNVLLILEDLRNDQYIALPVVQAIFAELGRPKAKVIPLSNPHVQGHMQAYEKVANDLEKYRKSHPIWIFLLDIDADHDVPFLIKKVNATGVRLACIKIVPEIEAWLLAGFGSELGTWQSIRNHHRLKEDIFQPFLSQKKLQQRIGGGRVELMRETLKNWNTVKTRCPEINELTQQLKEILEQIP